MASLSIFLNRPLNDFHIQPGLRVSCVIQPLGRVDHLRSVFFSSSACSRYFPPVSWLSKKPHISVTFPLNYRFLLIPPHFNIVLRHLINWCFGSTFPNRTLHFLPYLLLPVSSSYQDLALTPFTQTKNTELDFDFSLFM